MTLNYFRRADKSPVQFSISCLVRRLQSKMVKITTDKWCFAAWRIDKATSDSVNASEAGEIFAATNHTDDVFTFIGI